MCDLVINTQIDIFMPGQARSGRTEESLCQLNNADVNQVHWNVLIMLKLSNH